MHRVPSSQFAVLSNTVLDPLFRAGRRGLRTCARCFPLRTRNWQLGAALLVLAVAGTTLGHAQQIDFAVGGSTLWSSKPLSASQAFLPAAEKGGTYAQASLQYLTERHWGLNVEGAFRPKEGLYNGYQYYRVIFYDANAVYAHRFASRTRGDFMAGIGGQTLLFYNQTHCNYAGGCRTYVNSNHFLLHAGVGVRYYFWNRFFVRPEAHYYFIPNNFEFHSDHVFRIGASIGHTFGAR